MNNNKELQQERLLVKRAKRNKKEFATLYEKYKAKIRGYIFKKVNNDYIADDITSKVFEKALKNIDTFQWQGVSFGSWLYRIARNTVYDYYRTNKSNKREDLEEESIESEYDIDDVALRDEKELELYKVIAGLNENDQYLLYYKYFDELNNNEIAQKMNLSEQNVATKLHRIRKKMEKLLKNNII